MEDEKQLTMYDLKQRMREDIKDSLQELKDNEYPEDVIHEMADSNVPVYNGQLLELALSDLFLASDEPEFYAFGGEHNAVNAIAGNIFLELMEVANEEFEKLTK